MGVMRFRIHPPERLTDEMVQQAYLTGLDRVAWRVESSAENGVLSLYRSTSESANLHMPWHIERHGMITVSSGSLMERPAPYLIPLELARGTLSQLRDQLSDWQSIGLNVPQPVRERVLGAMQSFARATTNQDDLPTCTQHSEASLRQSFEAAVLLVATYTDQCIAVRRRGGGRLSAWLGGDLGAGLLDDATGTNFLRTFNAANVPICWHEIEATEGSSYWPICDRQIEWCRAHNLRTVAGPLLKLSPHGLPDWLALWEDDFDNLLAFVEEFVRSAVTRYRGQVDLWQCAGRVNTGDVLCLSEQDKLRLTARSVELVRQLDPEVPAAISLDQPWAEYMSRHDADFPPLHFADTLIRAGLNISGLVLEMNLGASPGGTLPRSPLELSRQLDAWGALGLPLYLYLSTPSDVTNDPLARRSVQLPPGKWTPRIQQAWIARYVPLMLAKPYVAGVFWNQLRDAELHEFPHTGLFDHHGRPKPALKTLGAIRHAHLR
ncbi:MAG: hypothetical protein RBS80_12145 [Thermoguttaceae bacterium]|nr:hypothetical protein [Thermoguttaceae bacterium]